MIDLWFPTAIFKEHCVFHNEIEQALLNKIVELQINVPSGGENWVSKDLYNTCGTYNIVDDPVFEKLNEWITNQVNVFAEQLGVNPLENYYKPKTGWANVYGKDSWQDLHYHAGFTFSAVYCLKSNADSSPLCFESPLEPDMKPLPVVHETELTFKSTEYKLNPGNLYVFRSYLRHYVPRQDSTSPRITISYNFDLM